MADVFPYILHNDDIVDAGETRLAAGQVGLLSGWGVFSTIRVIRGILFEFDRHFARMKKDAALVRVPFPADPAWIENRLLRLVEANGAADATLRVAVVRNRGGLWEGPPIGRDYDLIGLMAPLSNWGDSVRLAVAPHARHSGSRFAGAKILSWAPNLAIHEEAIERGFGEAVLLNERGEVAECTSANLFVANDGAVWTPPLDSGCLPGITRELLLRREVTAAGITVGEKVLTLDDLAAADEVFMTSTTRNLLPVSEVEGVTIRHAWDVCDRLNSAFEAYIKHYADARAASRA